MSVCNIAKSWIISGFIENPHNVLGGVDLPLVTFSQRVNKKQNRSRVRNSKKPKLNMVHINVTNYHAIIRYILADFVKLRK